MKFEPTESALTGCCVTFQKWKEMRIIISFFSYSKQQKEIKCDLKKDFHFPRTKQWPRFGIISPYFEDLILCSQ